MNGFLGMRGTGDWQTDQRPKSWREMILYLYPNGMAPMTAIMAKMGSSKVTDPQFNWWTKTLSIQAGDITGVYSDSNLQVKYVSGGLEGDILYVKMAAALASEIRVGHQVLLRAALDLTLDVGAKVVGRQTNGDSSYVQVLLLEADDNSTASTLADATRLMIVGSINAEGAAMPDAIAYDPIKWYNFTQIFRNPLEISRTAMETTLRTGPAYQEAKREALEYHSIEMEKAFLFGVPTERMGTNNKPERTTLGLIPAIKGGYTGHGGAAGTVDNFALNADYAGQTWLQGGEDWLDTQLAKMFKYGKREKLAFCGDGTLLALNKIVKNGGDYTFTPSMKSYGISVVEWVTPLGKINLVTHPMFSQEPTMTNTMVIYEPDNAKYRFVTDTTFYDDKLNKNTGYTRRDGIKEEYLTEAGLEYHHPAGWGYLTGFGSNNNVS